jgi:hypothetical protein
MKYKIKKKDDLGDRLWDRLCCLRGRSYFRFNGWLERRGGWLHVQLWNRLWTRLGNRLNNRLGIRLKNRLERYEV